MPYSAPYYNLSVLPTGMLDLDWPFETALAEADSVGSVTIL